MGLQRKLQKWVDAGLIAADQRAAIIAHEKSGSGNLLKHGIGYIGVFSILLGLAMMVAANWQDISNSLKLGIHFAVNALLAALVFIWRDNPERRMHREAALFALWGLSLTLIALIGQIFQLSGDAFGAARLWFWITTPMIVYLAQGRYLTSIWAVFFVLYVPAEIGTFIYRHVSDPNMQCAVLIFIALILPLMIWLAGTWPKLAALRPAMAKTARNLGLLLGLAGATAASAMFYMFPFIEREGYPEISGTLYDPLPTRVAAISAIAIALMSYHRLRKIFTMEADQRGVAEIICLCAAMTAMPFILFAGNDMLAMLHFVFLWLAIGYLAQRANLDRLINLAIILVTIRLFIGFLEIFGSMMLSGVGFIVIGCVMFALLYGARVVKRKLKAA